MGRVYRKQLVEGISIPAIIHNSNYFLIQMAVYEDGTVSCWHKSDLEQFWNDLQKGWVVPDIPLGKEISVHGLGDFLVKQAEWSYNSKTYYQHVKEVVQTLNPEMENLYHTTKREIDKWEKARVVWSGSPTECKLKKGLGYDLLRGDGCYMFYRKEGQLSLTYLTIYEDKTAKIGVTGEESYTQEQIHKLIEQDLLCAELKQEEWVLIEGLGKVYLAPDEYNVSIKEKTKEIDSIFLQVAGEKTPHERCIDAYHQYLVEPDDWHREKLRAAYEAVPEHERMYLGDMDTKDGDFIRILYHPQDKREV